MPSVPPQEERPEEDLSAWQRTAYMILRLKPSRRSSGTITVTVISTYCRYTWGSRDTMDN
jgi:hypothetical protein